MSADPTGTEVFAEIDPDPDAVLEELSVDSPDDIDDDAGAHEPATDELDVDDTTAAELFADLQQVTTDKADDVETNRAEGSGTPDADDLEFEFIGDADVTVRADGAVIESSAAELSRLTSGEADSIDDGDSSGDSRADSDTGDSRTDSDTGDSSDEPTTSGGVSSTLTVRSGDELELVGPDPTPTRVTNESFSHNDAATQ